MAKSLHNLANLYQNMGQYAKAEPLYQRSLKIMESKLGPDHPDVATNLNNLAILYEHMGQYAKAEPLYQRSLKIYESKLGPDHPNVAQYACTTWRVCTLQPSAGRRPLPRQIKSGGSFAATWPAPCPP